MDEDLRKKLAERTARIRKEIAEASTDIKTAVAEKGKDVDEQVRVLLDKLTGCARSKWTSKICFLGRRHKRGSAQSDPEYRRQLLTIIATIEQNIAEAEELSATLSPRIIHVPCYR